MPVRSGLSNGSGIKVSRKVRVVAGESKGLRDGIATLGPKSTNVEKARRKVVLTTGGSERLSGYVKTAESAKKRGKKVQGRGNDNDAVSFVDANEKLSGKKTYTRKDLKTKHRNAKFEAVSEGQLKQVKKNSFGNRALKTSDNEAVSFVGVNEKLSGKKTSARKDLKGNNRNARFEAVSEGKLKQVKKISFGNRALKTSDNDAVSFVDVNEKLSGKKTSARKDLKAKHRNARFEAVSEGKLKQVKNNSFGNRALKTSENERDPVPTKRGISQNKYAVGSVEKAHKKKVQSKRGLATDLDLMEDPPKKKKRVIRIDPHDISNKRLDDNTSNNGNSHVKKDFEDNVDVEMSKNAQFRAIRPSASILSFVEDNLLGRRRDIEFRRAGYNTEISAPLDNIPFSTGSERERIEVPVFRNKLEFFAAAKVSSSFPPDLPEIAFAGRSNVGKSSLLNSLTRQWGVVRTSDKPGLTQTINFFKLGSKLSLVDLPGYGFAYAKDEVKEAWEELVKEYVSTRVGLKRVCLLVDTKWGIKPRDHELIDLMERSETKYQIVLTKTDLVFPIDVARQAMQIEENLKAKKSAVQPLMMVSSKTGAGIRSLRTVLANVARLARR